MRQLYGILGSLLLIGGLFSSTVLAQPQKQPQWIWGSQDRNTEGKATLRKEFTLSKPLRKAELLGVTDFADAEIFINGKSVLNVPDYSLPRRIDVTTKLRSGRNTITAKCQASAGPSAVAMTLKLSFRDGTQRVLATDPSWSQIMNPHAMADSFGSVGKDMLPDSENDVAINPLDDYTQWKRAIGAEEGADPSVFSVQDGFSIERLRSARESEGSWVSIVFDNQDRLIVGKEDQGLLRMTLPGATGEGKIQVETINDSLKECRGLLWAHGSLYASANNSKGLYRLRDTTGDDEFDEVKLLYKSSGGVGHGRNDLALGPDGKIYLICGDAVDLPENFRDRCSPYREHALGNGSREGHLLRFDPDGSHGEIVAAGLRNPYGVAFHPTTGDAFTYDADAEYDMGSPWYRPTRIVHIAPGSDYGWRGVTKTWPPYFPDHADNAPPVLDIGKGSPTGVKFHNPKKTNNFQPPYSHDKLYVSDWAYGRILRVGLTPRGAGYVGRASTFVKGQPFNVTDLDFGPDGAMYIVTGGRKTQSALYRVTCRFESQSQKSLTEQQIARDAHSKKARKLRRELEALHRPDAKDAVKKAWPHLKSRDPWIQNAARTAIEHQPIDTWEQYAFSETHPTAALQAMLALARAPGSERNDEIIAKLLTFPLKKFREPEKRLALDALLLCLEEKAATDRQAGKIFRHTAALFPHSSATINRAILRVLAQVPSAELVPRVSDWLPSVNQQADRLHVLFQLRDIKVGWTEELRDKYFQALLQMREFRGGEGMPTFIKRIEADALAALDQSMRPKYQALLDQKPQFEPFVERQGPVVKEWKIADLERDLLSEGKQYDFELGKKVFEEALCIRCHRVGFEGAAVGPDLTSVGRRFSRRDLLESILKPSLVVAEQYRLATIATRDGTVLTGQIIPSRDYRSPKLQIATKPLEPYDVTEIDKSEIESHEMSKTSVMPKGLLNKFTKREILELIAWLEAGGNRQHPNYSK